MSTIGNTLGAFPALPSRLERKGATKMPSASWPGEFAISELDPARAQASVRHRLASVDALRGFAMFWILGGDAVARSLREISSGKEGALPGLGRFFGVQLTHADWEGFHFYDLILPLFVFITGVSIVLSLDREANQKGSRVAALRIARRALLLFALGLIYYGGASHNWPDVRLLGVLQRIALCYFVGSLLFLALRTRGLVAVCGAILLGYWALMTFVPTPGIAGGSLLPNANLAWWVDANYLPGRLWDGTQDPEGLLSTLPAIATCLLGVLAGRLLTSERRTPKEKSLWLIGAGMAMASSGYLWGMQFPIIKFLWTSSFVLVAGGYSAILLGLCHHISDVWKHTKWVAAFIWIGANAIGLYMANNLYGFDLIARRLVGGDISGFLDRYLTIGTGDFLAAMVGLTIAVWIARFLYNRDVFIRV